MVRGLKVDLLSVTRVVVTWLDALHGGSVGGQGRENGEFRSHIHYSEL